MKKLLAIVAFMFASLGAQAASAQAYQPGDELRGHSVQVDTNGEASTINFDADGTARISAANGAQATGRWFMQGQTICLSLESGAQECWPYQAAFRTGVPVTLVSSCSITSQWTPNSTAAPPAPVQDRRGERG